MREIKFRAWDKEEKRWIDLNGFDIEFKTCLSPGKVYLISEQGVLRQIPLEEVELMQFTEIKMFGKDVYFDDLVSNNFGTPKEVIRQVVLYKGCMMLKRVKGMSKLPEYISLYKHYNINFKIKGNIHENPELL